MKKFVDVWCEYVYYPLWRLFRNIKTEIRNFPRNFKRGLKWFGRGYHSYDWDYHYLYELIEHKLKDMDVCITKYASHTRTKRVSIMMQYALHHLSYMTEDYKCVEELFDLHRKKFGNSRMDFGEPDKHGNRVWKGLLYKKCKTSEENEYADKVHS